jgi:glucokinase
MARVFLAGDVGGTKTHLALYRPGESPRAPASDRKLASRDYTTLEALLRAFLDGARERPRAMVLGIAGPVVGNRVEATNLPWHIDGAALGEALGAPVTLINDLTATAWGLGVLEPGEIEMLQPGTPQPGNRGLVAAGTGLCEALLVWNGTGWTPVPSEGGHADFGPRDPLEDELLEWLRARYGHVSWERVLSGPGLVELYEFLSATGRGEEPQGFAGALADSQAPAAVIAESAAAGANARATLALERFASIYGAEAGNVALKFLAVGGVFLGGGIAPRILPFLRDPGFRAAFRAKGRLEPVLERIPVGVVLDDRAALWGAATLALGGPQAVRDRATEPR